jgi:hypothetical protein
MVYQPSSDGTAKPLGAADTQVGGLRVQGERLGVRKRFDVGDVVRHSNDNLANVRSVLEMTERLLDLAGLKAGDGVWHLQ